VGEWLLFSLLGLAGLLGVVRWPVWALIAITGLQSMPDLGIVERLTELHLVAAFGAIVALRLFIKPPPGRVVPSRLRLFLILFVGLELLSVAWGGDPLSSLDGLFKYSKAVALAWLLSIFIRERRELLALLAMLVAIGVLGAVISIYGITVLQLPEGGSSLFQNTNANAFFFLLAQPFAYILMRGATTQWLQKGLLGFVVLFLVGILATGSRGAMLGAVVLWAGLLFRDRKNIAIYVAVALGVLCLAVAIPYMHKNVERIGELRELGEKHIEERSLSGRKALLLNGLRSFIDRPIFGYGLQNGRFRVAEMIFNKPKGSIDSRWLATHGGRRADLHNTYLTVAVDMGALGLLLFLVICFMSLRMAWSLGRTMAIDDPYLLAVSRYLPMALLGLFLVIVTMTQHQRPLLWLAIVLPLIVRNVLASENVKEVTVNDLDNREGMHQVVFSPSHDHAGLRG